MSLALTVNYQELTMKNALARQKGEKITPYEFSFTDHNGQQRWGYLYADTLEYEGSPAIVGIIVDITERKRLEVARQARSRISNLIKRIIPNHLNQPTDVVCLCFQLPESAKPEGK